MTSSRPRHDRAFGRGRLPERRGGFTAVKPREYGTTEDIVRRACDEAGGIPKVAGLFDVTPAVVYAMSDPNVRGEMSLKRAFQLTKAFRVTAFAEAFSAAAGGAFFPAPNNAAAQSLVELGALSNTEMADLITAILDAVADGKITDRERRTMLIRLDAVLHTLLQERAKLVGMESGGEA
jgi:hypothetical protein